MADTLAHTELTAPAGDAQPAVPSQPAPSEPPSGQPARQAVPFIVQLDGADYHDALRRLSIWVDDLLLPIYGRETGSMAPWCPLWWEHREAVAQLYGLWMTWAELTGPGSALTGPANWHRDYLGPVMASLRDPAGPFAGCKAGAHRVKEVPHSAEYLG